MDEDELEYQLEEANLEIARHHKSFLKIQKILDEEAITASGNWDLWRVLRKIRNIVG